MLLAIYFCLALVSIGIYFASRRLISRSQELRDEVDEVLDKVVARGDLYAEFIEANGDLWDTILSGANVPIDDVQHLMMWRQGVIDAARDTQGAADKLIEALQEAVDDETKEGGD